jgi:hypothetical protein
MYNFTHMDIFWKTEKALLFYLLEKPFFSRRAVARAFFYEKPFFSRRAVARAFFYEKPCHVRLFEIVTSPLPRVFFSGNSES